jgi:hypothetical protein
MAATVTTIMNATVMGPETKVKRIKMALDAYATGGYDISSYVSDDFSVIYNVTAIGDDTTDAGYLFKPLGTALSAGGLDAASTLKLGAFWGGGAGAVFPEITNATAMTGIVLTVTIEGK